MDGVLAGAGVCVCVWSALAMSLELLATLIDILAQG